MKKIQIFLLFLISVSLFAFPQAALAQDYRYTISAYEVEAYIEEDGTLSLYYYMEFQIAPNGAAIEFVDIGLPTSSFNRSVVQAELDSIPITKIESSPYVTYGFALNLEDRAIPSGESGVVTAWIPGIGNVLYEYTDDDREGYASFLFSPNWFDPAGDKTDGAEYRMTIILPPGVGDDEGVYYFPERWPGDVEPDDVGRTAADDRVYYSWFSDQADTPSEYFFWCGIS
jgi:hypothetical protein